MGLASICGVEADGRLLREAAEDAGK